MFEQYIERHVICTKKDSPKHIREIIKEKYPDICNLNKKRV